MTRREGIIRSSPPSLLRSRSLFIIQSRSRSGSSRSTRIDISLCVASHFFADAAPMFLCEILVLRTEGARFVARNKLRSRTFQIFHRLRSTRWCCCRYTISLLRSAAAAVRSVRIERATNAFTTCFSDAGDAKIHIEFTGTANLSRK